MPPDFPDQDQPPVEKRSVVSSFIFRFTNPSEPPVVALFQRSDKVRTYPHHLAPIAGCIETTDPTPLSAAWRELHEETTLDSTTLTHWRTGKPFTFLDPSINREWTIHPFAFKLTSPSTTTTPPIKTDWEHTNWSWYDPSTILTTTNNSIPTVPRLRTSLKRVYFESTLQPARAAKTLSAGLDRLRTDHTSGSQELTSIALVLFRDFIIHTGDLLLTHPEKWWETVRLAAWHLIKNGRESMGAATMNALVAVLDEIEDILADEKTGAYCGNHTWERVLTVLDHHLASRKGRAEQVRDAFANYVRFRFLHHGESRDRLVVLTVSASSTIRDSILDAYEGLDIDTLEVRVLESRPLFEGASVAASLVSGFRSRVQDVPGKDLRVKVYTDAAAAVAADGVDLLLLGADRISVEKGVSNKTGSLPAVLSVRYASPEAQVVVLSDLEKINCPGSVVDDEHHEENDPAEVVSAWRNDGVEAVRVLEEGMDGEFVDDQGSSRVEVKNVYFEWVPLYMVDAFVSEEGVLDGGRIREKSNDLAETVNRYFEDL
ncbi:translation initiation factor eIF-2B subunit family protein [Aspergillus heteromorphus CBS 117.55]|uniref:Translation initiation factor eIF-2B subunit family protein n=1 Tax=Aspergillus heteromorphus CBS 117.55 TaxID=1448321 RepID=A0A317VR01_9EURO|nr:translation initiation factor eIF-2B subunit family protein [Aspergillus heteromorphus CBS 117.55]PWY74340.1 translation initiation factor eIF-2B subunit family protein [Aspergillus heteromorphus CBS 117.55]